MKKLLLIFILFPIVILSQERYVDAGLLRTQGNLAFGFPLTRNGTNMYFAGDVDYYLQENISVNGGIFYYMGENGGVDLYSKNHSMFAGVSYHFKTNNKLDPYAGFQPGLSLNQLNPIDTIVPYLYQPMVVGGNTKTSVNPLFSVNIGVNYFANRYFNLFVNLKYQTGKHYSEISAQPLDELKLTLGLGYMIWAKKGYCKFKKPE